MISSSSQASGEVTSRVQGTSIGSSNTKPTHDDMKNTDYGSISINAGNSIQKEMAENVERTSPSPSSTISLDNVAAAAATPELDGDIENERESFECSRRRAECILKKDKVDGKNENPGAPTNADVSSISSTVVLCADATDVDHAKSISNAGVTNADSNANGVEERKEKALVKEAPKKRTRKKWKKPPGKPNRPLSAYNLYFRKERAIMLGDAAEKTDQEQGKKRVHRKTHGKIGFAEMARIIGAKWKALPPEDKEEFVKVAVVEKERYAKSLAKWREEQNRKTITNSMGPGRKSKIERGSGSGRGSDVEDDVEQSIADDRENLIRQHQAFRMQMMQEMQVGHLRGLPSEGHGRQMPSIDYLRNMQDDRTGPFFGTNRSGAASTLFSHYPSAAEGSGRDLYQQMVAMTSGPDCQGHEPDQLRQLKIARMQIMNGSMANGPGSSSVVGTMGSAMGGSMGSAMNNLMGPSMSTHTGNSMTYHGMSNPIGNQMGNNSMGITMGNAMGMIPINNSASQMSNPAPNSQYEMERFQHMRFQSQIPGMNNQMQIGTNSPGRTNSLRRVNDMALHEGSSNNHTEASMMRFQHQNRYN